VLVAGGTLGVLTANGEIKAGVAAGALCLANDIQDPALKLRMVKFG